MGNVAQTKIAISKIQVVLPFSAGSLSQATTGTLLNTGITGHQPRVMPSAGSVYGLAGSYSTALTAGTVTLWPMINGTVNQGLVATNDAASAVGVSKFGSARVVNFNQNDTLQVIYKTSGLDAAGGALECDVYIFYEDINI